MKKSILFASYLAAGTLMLAACGGNKPQSETSESATSPIGEMAGTYASPAYQQRGEGYDWVGVRVTQLSDTTAHVAFRSRADQKKATCFFDIDTKLMNDSTLEGNFNGASLYFTIAGGKLTVSAAADAPGWALSYPCSGGAQLNSEVYVKIDGDLDPSQVDKTVFFKSVEYGAYLYNVTVTGDELTIEPIGFETTEAVTLPLNGQAVKDAEAGDLNGDGFPELVIYTHQSKNNAGLIGYSPNNGKSLSQFAWKPIGETPELSAGYQGGEEYALIEGSLSVRFPLYDDTGAKTGKTRQAQYKLVDGEAMRLLKVVNVSEY